MKIEQVLVHYLLRTKKLTLQGIGTFQLEGPIQDSDDPERPVVIPGNSISFQYNPKAGEDEDLVNFIVIHTRKIKPLASSDLDSFLSLGRQFLNIGKPFVLQNLGTLDKLNSGELVFQPGHIVAQKMEPQKIKSEEPENTGEEENLFNDYQKDRKSNFSSKGILALIVLIILGLAVWATWHYGFSKKNNDENLKSTESIVPIAEDSSHLKKDSTVTANAAADSLNNVAKKPTDVSGFKIVVRKYRSKEAATARLNLLKNYHRNVIMYTTDSVIYKIAEPFSLPLSDTTKMLDSLKRYYAKIYVEVN
ncbi:MAG: hypothetical protein ABI261_02205 [Ginsengibacter sp.]